MVKLKKVFRLSLEELLGHSKSRRETFKSFEACVLFYLFSNYPERRKFGLKRIKEYFDESSRIATEKKDGIIWAYLFIDRSRPYILVGKYPENHILYEPAPSEDERKKWKEFDL